MNIVQKQVLAILKQAEHQITYNQTNLLATYGPPNHAYNFWFYTNRLEIDTEGTYFSRKPKKHTTIHYADPDFQQKLEKFLTGHTI